MVTPKGAYEADPKNHTHKKKQNSAEKHDAFLPKKHTTKKAPTEMKSMCNLNYFSTAVQQYLVLVTWPRVFT